MSTTTISPRGLLELARSGQAIELIDVRTPAEFQEVHVPFARNVPLDRLQPEQIAAGCAEDQRTLYVICRSGSRSQQACRKLLDAGISRIVNVEGGTQAWDQAGLPVVRGRKVLSLERQVRIVSGSIVLISSLLGVFISPYFTGLAALVGAGLIHAGITDRCGMGMLLARMPWNQVPRAPATATADAASSPEKSTCCASGSGGSG